jgi:hypothetical protein
MGAVKNYFHDEICAREVGDSFAEMEMGASVEQWRGRESGPLPFWPSEAEASKPLHPAVLHQPKTCNRCGKAWLFWHRSDGNWRLHHYADVGDGPRFILHRCGFDSAGEPWPAQGIEAPLGDETRSGSAVGESPVDVVDAPDLSPPPTSSSKGEGK